MENKKIKIYTTLSVLEKAGDLLFELGLENIIGLGQKSSPETSDLIMKLTHGRKLREFLNIITKDEMGEVDLEFSDCVTLVHDFFFAIMKSAVKSAAVLNQAAAL